MPSPDPPRYVVIDGRRWRASDPQLPDALRRELVAELMAARRAVRDQHPRARSRVQDAKVALGERGRPWWEPASGTDQRKRLAAAMRALLRHRDPAATICPSDAARVAGGSSWRALVPVARDVADRLCRNGTLEARQHGQAVDLPRARGPVRLARGPAWPEEPA